MEKDLKENWQNFLTHLGRTNLSSRRITEEKYQLFDDMIQLFVKIPFKYDMYSNEKQTFLEELKNFFGKKINYSITLLNELEYEDIVPSIKIETREQSTEKFKKDSETKSEERYTSIKIIESNRIDLSNKDETEKLIIKLFSPNEIKYE